MLEKFAWFRNMLVKSKLLVLSLRLRKKEPYLDAESFVLPDISCRSTATLYPLIFWQRQSCGYVSTEVVQPQMYITEDMYQSNDVSMKQAVPRFDKECLQSIAKGLTRVRNFRVQAKNQKIISSNDEKCFFFQTENYDVFDIDEMLIIF